MVEKYDINIAHTWVLVFNNGEYKKYENESLFFERLNLIYKDNHE